MNLQLLAAHFSSYIMKALIALGENETPFDFRILGPDQPENTVELARRWPVARFLLLVDGGTTVFETSAIIEYLTAFHAGPLALIPTEILTVLTAYRARLLARPSFARGVEDARTYRPFFPLGVPDQD